MDYEKLIKQLSEEGKNVPDNRKKIIKAAKAEGLLTDNSPKPSAVYNGSRTASAVKSNRIIAAIASLFVLGTVATAAIVPFVAGNGGGNTPSGPSIPPIPSIPSGPILCEEKLGTDYAIGAVSTAKLLGCFGMSNEKENNGATAVAASAKREALVEQEISVDAQINNFGTYFGAFGTFFGEGEDLVAVSEAPVKNDKYPNSIVIAGKYANGEDAEYAMYYLEALDEDNSTDDEKVYYLEGEIYIDGVYYYLEGSRTFLSTDSGSEAYDLVLRAYPDAENKGDYVQMKMGVNPDNPLGKSYDYRVFKDGKDTSQKLTYLPSLEAEKAFDLSVSYGDSPSKFTVYRPEAGKPIITVGYEIGTKVSCFNVRQTKDKAVCVITHNYIVKLNEEKKTCEITGYKADVELGEKLEIPEAVNGYTVTSIGPRAFEYRRELKEIIIPSTVTNISNSAFDTCYYVEKVEFNEGLTDINSYAFDSCSSLKEISIPASVTYIAYNAFQGCSGLENIEVAADNAKYTGAGKCLIRISDGYLLKGCSNSVIPDDGSVKQIEDRAFTSTTIKSVKIPHSVLTIGVYAFYNCNELEEVVMSDKITYIGACAFNSCKKLTKINLPDKLIEIQVHVFDGTAYMEDLSNWDVEKGYKALYIGKHLISLQSTSETDYPDVVIKAGTLTIVDEAFSYDGNFWAGMNCVNSVTLNKELLRIGYAPHIGGQSCQIITFDGENERYYTQGNCLMEKGKNQIIAGCDGSIIPEDRGITRIGEYAFAGCYVNDLVIPKNIVEIGRYAFMECKMTRFVIPNSVATIEESAFSGCFYLSEITFEEIEIDETTDYILHGLTLFNCFQNCNSLTRVVLPRHTMNILDTFTHCTNLGEIVINYDPTYFPGMSIHGIAQNCPNLSMIEFSGTSEQWKQFYQDELKFMPCSVHCREDGVILSPGYHE